MKPWIILLLCLCGCAAPSPKPTRLQAILKQRAAAAPAPQFPALAGVQPPVETFAATGGPMIVLGWDPSPSPGVAGYNLYYGPASRRYTNMVALGKVTNATVAVDLIVPRFFAVTAYDGFGVESDYSTELQYATVGGRQVFWDLPAGFNTYRVEMTTNFRTWLVVVPPFRFDRTNAFYRLHAVP